MLEGCALQTKESVALAELGRSSGPLSCRGCALTLSHWGSRLGMATLCQGWSPARILLTSLHSAVNISTQLVHLYEGTHCINGTTYTAQFGGNPVSMAIAESVLTVIEEENLQEQARRVGDFLVEQLMLLRDKHTCVGDVRGRGLCTGIDFVTDRETREPDPAKAREVKLRYVILT